MVSGPSAMLVVLGLTLSVAGTVAAPPARDAEKQPLVCRGGGERSLGSHIRTRRRCRTAEQWRQEDEERNRTPPLMITEGQNDGRGPRSRAKPTERPQARRVPDLDLEGEN